MKGTVFEVYWGERLICRREFKKGSGRKAKIEYISLGFLELDRYLQNAVDKYCLRRLAWVG